MQVFISWSQEKSRKIAEVLKEELYLLFNQEIIFWVSSKDIPFGDVSVSSIVNALQKSEMIITCLDSSNYKKSWLYFETGAVFLRNYEGDSKPIVFPVIFDNLEFSDFDGTPFRDLQLQRFNRNSIKRLAENINKRYEKMHGKPAIAASSFERYFNHTWSNLQKKINNIITQHYTEGDTVLTDKNVTDKLSKYKDFPTPSHGPVIRYDSGFETIYFYDFLLTNVSKRLYIFGRKNKKISDRTLNKKVKEILNKEIDFRLLYLNPSSDYAKDRKAQDVDNFKQKLMISMKDMCEIFNEKNLDISKCCRMYDKLRDSEIIIADEVVFYKDLAYSKDGKPLHFTNESFCITAINSELGDKYYKDFVTTWNECENERLTNSLVSTFVY